MNTITATYSLKWRHKVHYWYQWTKCGKLFNTRTGKQIKKTLNGGSIGYWIKGDFVTLSNLKRKIEHIPKELTPF